MDIRRARLEDASAVAAVHVRTWQAAYEHVFGREALDTLLAWVTGAIQLQALRDMLSAVGPWVLADTPGEHEGVNPAQRLKTCWKCDGETPAWSATASMEG